MPGPRDYTPTTRTALAALSRGTCYFPDCQRPVIVIIDGEPYVDVQIAHIYDANAGNRYQRRMSDDERRSFSNLILLCKPHHDLVDKRHPGRYRPEDLQAWKTMREGEIVVDDPTAISDDIIEEALLRVTVISIEEGGLSLGGKGGTALGSGGGGGGVIGSGTGGPGGPGATIFIPDGTAIDLAGTAGSAPGAGGGGAGVLGSGVLVRRANPDEGREGRGYSAGVDGQDGQPSSFGDPASEFYIEAPGGRGGLVGEGPRLVSDLLGVSLLTLVNSAEIRDGGLLFVLGGGWQNTQVINLGDRLVLSVALVFEAGGLDVGDYTAVLSVEDPAGVTMSTVPFPITVEESGDVVRIPRLVTIDAEVSRFGLWRVSAMHEERLLAFIDLMIKRAGTDSVSSSGS